MTNTVLRIDASARTEGSVSRQLADAVIDRLSADHVVTRELTASIPQIDGAWLAANMTPADQRSAAQRDTLALSDTLIDEIHAADTIVIATPIYNFGVPSSLKAWVDMIARAGITFKYTDTGPVGLLEGKRVIFAIASGGTEVNGPIDFATPWLRHVMGFVGITDVQVVRSDRQMVDPDASKARAKEDLHNLAA